MAGVPGHHEWADESALIAELFVPLTKGRPGACSLKDDAAWLSPPPGHDLVLSTDGLIEGVHFVAGSEASDIGWKALAVNISDLVAKGAEPLAYLMNIALPADLPPAWLRGFAAGLDQAQSAFGCVLIGGDTDRTPGPLSVSITAIGSLPSGTMKMRSTASAGDIVCVCGPIGDAHLGLRLEMQPALVGDWRLTAGEATHLRARLNRPVPPVRLAAAVLQHASASMDVSDGLAADLAKLVSASGCAAEIAADKIPLSAAAAKVLSTDAVSVADLVSGGEDYTILATLPGDRFEAFAAAAADAGHEATAIGRITSGRGVLFRDADGRTLEFERLGWDHLSA